MDNGGLKKKSKVLRILGLADNEGRGM